MVRRESNNQLVRLDRNLIFLCLFREWLTVSKVHYGDHRDKYNLNIIHGIIESCTIVCHGNSTNYELAYTEDFRHSLRPLRTQDKLTDVHRIMAFVP